MVGLPGDTIQVIDGVLNINGTPVPRQAMGTVSFKDEEGQTETVPAFRETLPNGVSYTTLDRGQTELDNTRIYQVPPGSYFMMGDDRDNSEDSRTPQVGFVPFDNLDLLRVLGEAAQDDTTLRRILVDNPGKLYGFPG